MSTESVDVILEYRRVGDRSSGELYLADASGARREPVLFENVRFDDMLYMLARKIEPYTDVVVRLVRTDRTGALAYKLDPATLSLLRTDPVAAVQAFTVPGSPSTLLMRTQQARKSSVPMLRAGFDVLADAFGELVYARFVNQEVECPGCGFWNPLEGDTLRCRKRCGVSLRVLAVGRWASIAVTDLLATGLDKFYLPRAWTKGPWVRRFELEAKYREFISEREAALCSKVDPAI